MADITDKPRISFLDGLRGVAILLVVLFHAYGNPYQFGRYPYGDAFAGPISYGWVGVQLFFMISGFVIFMTLEKCRNFREFICRRWLRLFPAMLLCSLIIYLTGPLFPDRFSGPISPKDLIPGITFIGPGVWAKLLGADVKSLESTFWSLFVEVKFYVIFGIMYFAAGWRTAVAGLIGLFLLATVALALRETAPAVDIPLLNGIVGQSGARYFGWFAAGALYYRYFREQRKPLLLAAMALAFASALAEAGWTPLPYDRQLATLSNVAVSAFFTLAVAHGRVQTLLAHPALLFFGFVSYPLYLVHENMLVAMIGFTGRQLPALGDILIPVLPIAIVVGVGWLVAVYGEPWVREWIRIPYKRFCILVGATRSEKSALNDKE